MKHLLSTLLLLCSYFGFSQIDSVLVKVSQLSSNQEKLTLLYGQINSKWFSDAKAISTYSKLYDSIAVLENKPIYNARAYHYKGISNYLLEKHDLAIELYLKALRILESGNAYEDLTTVYNNLAACYKIRKDFVNTEKYYLKSLEVSEKANLDKFKAVSWNNLSMLYTENKIYDKADTMSVKAINYYKEINNTINLGIAYLNYGNLKIEKEEYEEAITSYNQAKKHVEKSQIPLLHGVSQTGIGIALTRQDKIQSALNFLLEGVEISKEINHQGQLLESYNALAEYYAKTKKFKEAYNLSIESQKLKDSILSAEQDKNMAEALTKFETEKKDSELKFLQLETEKKEQQKQLYLIIAFFGFLITTIVTFFLFRSKKRRTLLNKQKRLLEIAIEDKNILLKETHHRVKNSFQMVASLLFLQSRSLTDTEAKKALEEARNRVHSMAIIHQKLYTKDQLTGVDTKAYFEDLIDSVCESYSKISKDVKRIIDVQSIILSIETITLIGLIVNELITNVFKHAFTSTSKDHTLQVVFKEINEELVLIIKDNGLGIDTTENSNSFGLKLIDSLSKKLKATIAFVINKNEGTEVVLNISEYEKL